MKRVHVYCDHCGKDCEDTFFEIWRMKFDGFEYRPEGKSDYCEECHNKLNVGGKKND